ncbi:MAG TPA: helix-turn-helix domain-containing GNAT family N-acetyltransferase [Myxococcaceae bacterium]|nr:helix-turn-helix domain-containing GNAT family N-acetyltransferase [Myxococcaceae bacterium]
MSSSGEGVDVVRGFNRLYTRRLGLLDQHHLGSEFGLGEVRVLYELAHHDGLTAATLARTLDLDPGHLSRMLARLRRRRMVRRDRTPADRRASVLALTPAGRRAFARLDRRAGEEIATLLGSFPPERRRALVQGLGALRTLLDPAAGAGEPVLIRSQRVGDLGWILERHGALYDEEYGWGEGFEAVVAQVIAQFARGHDARREGCWIAERAGRRAGSVMLVRHPEREGVARLRLLLVEPSARGLGVGRALVETCTHFARTAGYTRVTLWTQSVLGAARAIYAKEGYVKVSEAPNTEFGEGLVSEIWERVL